MQSYFFINKQKDTIEVSPHFATLISEDNEKYVFQIAFSVLQSTIVLRNLNKVIVRCVNPSIFIDKNSGSKVLNSISAKKLKHAIPQSGLFELDNIQLKHQKQKKMAESKRNSIVFETTVNLQNYVNSTVANYLKQGKKPQEIEELYSYKDTLSLLNDDYYYDDSSDLDQSDIKNYNFELISSGIHPVDAVSKLEKYPNDERINSLRNYYLNDSLQSIQRENAYYVVQKQKKINDKIAIRTFIEIPKKLVQNSFEVHFEVFQFVKIRNCSLFLRGTPIERIKKSIDLLKHQKFLRIQNQPPLVQVLDDQVEIKQLDKNSNSIKVEKKEINNLGECSSYALVHQGYVKPNEHLMLNEPRPDNKFCIFRCFSSDVDSTITNPIVGCAVTGKNAQINTLSMIINDRPGSLKGVEISVKHPPRFATQFRILKSTWTGSWFGPKTTVTDYRYFEGLSTVVLDDTVKNGDICEYFLDYKTSTGESRTYISQVHQYFKNYLSDSEVTVELTSPSITATNGEVEFSVIADVRVRHSDFEAVRDNAGAQSTTTNPQTLPENDLLNSSGYNYHHILHRLNLKTGERVVFYNNFTRDRNYANAQLDIALSDTVKNRKVNNISRIDLTSDYLYEVKSFRKNKLAATRDYISKVTLPPSSQSSSPKIYYYRPFKWRQNYTAETGTIPAMDEKNNLLTRTFMEDGEIGVTGTYLLSSLTKLLAINSLSAERVDANKVKLSWKLQGSPEEFDHIIIVKEVNKIRRFIGAAFGQELIDVLEDNDLGTIIYYAIPIFYDFSAGVASRSNTILVDPEELEFKKQSLES